MRSEARNLSQSCTEHSACRQRSAHRCCLYAHGVSLSFPAACIIPASDPSSPQAEALGGLEALRRQPLGHIPHPDPPELLPSLAELGRLADERERLAGAQQSRPPVVIGDAVTRFGEVDAARGALGR